MTKNDERMLILLRMKHEYEEEQELLQDKHDVHSFEFRNTDAAIRFWRLDGKIAEIVRLEDEWYKGEDIIYAKLQGDQT